MSSPPKGNKTRRNFLFMAAGAVSAATLGTAVWPTKDDMNTPIKRPLTEKEIKLAHSVFGHSIDYKAVSVSNGRYGFFHPKGKVMTPNGNLYMDDSYSADYAQENSRSRGLFIHEMTHVWQFQNGILYPVIAATKLQLKHKFNYDAAYSFHLDETKDLAQYGMEQQASIVQEYFLAKHEGVVSKSGRCTNSCGGSEKIRLYEKVLEKFLKDPSYARQKKLLQSFKRRPPHP